MICLPPGERFATILELEGQCLYDRGSEFFINIYVYKYRCNEVPSVFQNIFLSLGTVTDNCVAISFILLPLSKRISQWYQFHSDVEDNSSCNDDYQLDYQVILHTTIYLLYVPQQRI